MEMATGPLQAKYNDRLFCSLSILIFFLGLFSSACTPRPKATLDPSTKSILWQRSGGIAGICQELTIYGDRRYEIVDCANGEKLASGELPEDRWLELRAYLVEYSAFEYETVPPQGSADMFTDQYTFFGGGSRMPSEEAKLEINEFLAALTGKLIEEP
jgi:hypothetical protein